MFIPGDSFSRTVSVPMVTLTTKLTACALTAYAADVIVEISWRKIPGRMEWSILPSGALGDTMYSLMCFGLSTPV